MVLLPAYQIAIGDNIAGPNGTGHIVALSPDGPAAFISWDRGGRYWVPVAGLYKRALAWRPCDACDGHITLCD